MTYKYILGIDGGGTKTLGVLYDLKGQEVSRKIFGYSNFSVSPEVSKQHIEETIDYFTQLYKDKMIVVCGIAGASKLVDQDGYKKELEAKYSVDIIIVSDAEIALYSIKKDTTSCAIMVLGGTGSAIMLSEGNTSHIIGGFGHILGDEGSGYHLSITALKNIINEYEENEEVSELSKLILKEIKAESYFDIKSFVYNQSKSDIAALSEFIASCAMAGNEMAKDLFIEQGKHLARQTILAYKKLNVCDNVVIGIRGGFLLNAPFVKETLISELEKSNINVRIDLDPCEPVVGAYYLGLKKVLMR